MKIFFTTLISIISICHSWSQDSPENFDKFLFLFATDEQFQLERIKFPLEVVTWKSPQEAGDEIDTLHIEKENWEHDYLFANQNYRAQIFDNFEGQLRDTDERLFQWVGVETGINVKYFFKRFDGKWFLIRKEDLGD